MKLNSVFFALFFVFFVSCGKTTTNPPENTKTPPKEPVVVTPDPDIAKYGKSITLGSQTYPINTFTKLKYDLVDYMEVVIDQPGLKLVAHVARMDKKAFTQNYSVEALGAGYITDRASPNIIMATHTNADKKVMAIVNGDFYNLADPKGTVLGTQVSNGQLMKTAGGGWKLTYGITKANEFFIDELNYTMTVGANDYAITNINSTRGESSLILYTTSYGEKTGTNVYGAEILLKPVAGDWETLGSYENVVCEVVSNAPSAVDGGLAVPKGHIVLSGHGPGNLFVNTTKKGDKLTVKISKPKGKAGTVYDVKEAIGTPYPILEKGVVKSTTSSSGNPGGKEPRTAVGYSATHFYMVAVEGRQVGRSDGLTTVDLGHLIKHFDATDAVNLDGGGSTMLAIGNFKHGQGPTATWFRPVPNAFSIVKKLK